MDTRLLKFDWPIGLILRVTETREQHRADLHARADASYLLTVAEHPRGMAVLFSDHDRRTDYKPTKNPFDPKVHVDYVAESGPSFVVEGHEVAGLLDGVGDRVRIGLAPPPGVAVPEPLASILQRIGQDSSILVAAQNLWNPLVSSLVDLANVEGMVATSEVRQPVPALGGAVLPFMVEQRLSQQSDGQVQVVTTTQPDSRIHALMAESLTAPGTGGIRVESFQEEVVSTVLTQPATGSQRSMVQSVPSSQSVLSAS